VTKLHFICIKQDLLTSADEELRKDDVI